MSGLIDTFFNTEVMWRAVPMLMRGLVNTFYLAVTAIVIGTFAGILICIARLCRLYVQLMPEQFF